MYSRPFQTETRDRKQAKLNNSDRVPRLENTKRLTGPVSDEID